MRLKPKQTVKNPKALIYRRFNRIETSTSYVNVYKTSDNKYWMFNSIIENFYEIEYGSIPANASITNISAYIPSEPITIRAPRPENPVDIVQYKNIYFEYVYHLTDAYYSWEQVTLPSNVNLLKAMFGNISRYQTNSYYFAGTFDYIIKGQQEGGTTQFIKGNITPLTSMSIKYYSDTANLQPDDLVVIGKHLYSVENPETVYKQQPKPYAIHYVTLNSIL